eukprot:1444306-Pyramimonas_sp.AAC.1
MGVSGTCPCSTSWLPCSVPLQRGQVMGRRAAVPRRTRWPRAAWPAGLGSARRYAASVEVKG